MDVTLKFDTVEAAVAAVNTMHPAAYKLEATSQGWSGEIYFDPEALVVILVHDSTDDAMDPVNAYLEQVEGFDWIGDINLVDTYAHSLENLEDDDDEADKERARQLINEALTVYATCKLARLSSYQGADADEKASVVNALLAARIEQLKIEMSLLASLRAQNILNRLEARDHRHGAKREVAKALMMKPQNIQDVLASYYRRLNIFG